MYTLDEMKKTLNRHRRFSNVDDVEINLYDRPDRESNTVEKVGDIEEVYAISEGYRIVARGKYCTMLLEASWYNSKRFTGYRIKCPACSYPTYMLQSMGYTLHCVCGGSNL